MTGDANLVSSLLNVFSLSPSFKIRPMAALFEHRCPTPENFPPAPCAFFHTIRDHCSRPDATRHAHLDTTNEYELFLSLSFNLALSQSLSLSFIHHSYLLHLLSIFFRSHYLISHFLLCAFISSLSRSYHDVTFMTNERR